MSAPHGAPHGSKRPADSALDGEQRLAKRFDRLNLDNARKSARLHMPVAAAVPRAAPAAPAAPASAPPASPDAMLVDDTPHRLFIPDLDAELTALDSDEDHPIFLPDIEKHISQIPRHLLLGPQPTPTLHNQLVLYNVPASLSVPAEHDSVRKAIVDTRQRMRESQASRVTEPERVLTREDADAMELD
ncbi:hypothetical protein EJ07DRAFT_165974 [Lizonia empirigonia]|nr:hypothetical protein EJ07DRAFT_165974 [Lizonia empirigonia]